MAESRCDTGKVYVFILALTPFLYVFGCGVGDPCANPPTAIITADRYQLYKADGSQSKALLQAFVLDGKAPFTYLWTVKDPSGELAGELFSINDSSRVELTAGDRDGPYVAYCTVTDQRGCEATSEVVVNVGNSVGLDLTADRYGVVAGGGTLGKTVINLNLSGGAEPYDVSWLTVGPDGNIDDDRLTTDDPFAPVFESSEDVGTYILTATVVDASGVETVASIIVVVGQQLGLDVAVSRSIVLPGGGDNGKTSLLATPIGGKEPYSYDWQVIGPDGLLYTELLWDSSVRSPIFESADDSDGQYLVRCSVTDSEGTILIGSTSVFVGQQMAVDLSSDRLTLAVGNGLIPGGTGTAALLSTDLLGGRQPVSISYAATGPNGVDASNRLTDATDTGVTFTSSNTTGRYLVRVTATDANGVKATDSLVVTVGGTLGVTISAERDTVAATTGAQGRTVLTAYDVGGEPAVLYQWSVTGPNGLDQSNLLSDSTIQNPTFTGTTIAGTYSVFCVVTDSSGSVAMDVIKFSVGQPLSADVTVDRQALVAGGGVGGQAQLTTVINGGVAPYQYQWTVTADDGTQDATRLNSTVTANPVFTSTTTTGTYHLTCNISDSLGSVFTDSVEIVVSSTGGGAAGQDLSLDVSADKQTVAPGGNTASLSATVTGGITPITYSWAVTDPGGATDNSMVDSTTNQNITFTSNATLGTYRLRCTVTDAVGSTFTDSLQINVTDQFLLDLSTSISSGIPGSSATLTADRTGGSANFTYNWGAVNSASAAAGTFGTGSTGVGTASHVGADDVTNTWTAPATAISSPETYRITCTATDSQGAMFSSTVHIVIEPATPLSVEIVPNTVFILPGQSVNLSADQTGGAANYNFSWDATDSTGTSKGTFTTGSTGAGTAAQNGQPGDVTNVWTAPAAAAGTLDTYQIKVTLTDNLGDSVNYSVYVVVQSPLALNVTASDTFVTPSTAVNLLADQAGGEPDYDYSWTANSSAGAASGTFTSGSTGVGAAVVNGAAGDSTNSWSIATPGTYTINCTVTDNAGQTFTDSVTVVVTTQDGFSIDLTVDKILVRPNEQVNLLADQTGGTANYGYAWSAVNEAGASAGTFGTVNHVAQAGDVTNTWLSPFGTGAEGTYRIRCTATDASGNLFTDSVFVEVSSRAIQNLFLAPAVADTASVYGGSPLNIFASLGDPGQQISAGFVNPAHPRNIVVLITDPNNSVTGGSARITGLDARGQAITEIVTIAGSAAGSSTNVGIIPFSIVTRLDVYGLGGRSGNESVSLGVGSKFGLTGVIDAATDVLYVSEGGTVLNSGYTVDAVAGQQGITFSNAPNGARNYVVVFRAQ